MSGTRRILIVVGISLCAVAITGCEPAGTGAGQVWTVNEQVCPADAAVRAQMQNTAPKLDFSGIAFKDVVQFLREVSSVNIHVRWGALEAVGVDKASRVNVHLRNVTLAKTLQVILDDVGGVTPLGYVVEEGVITISTCDDLSRSTITRIYDVSDLVKPGPLDKTLLRQLLRDAIHQPVGAAQESEDVGSSSSAAWDDDDDDDLETLAEVYRERINDLADAIAEELRNRRLGDLMDVIRINVAPDTWIENSGTIGSIREFGGKLVITQTRENHRYIRALLSAMREQTQIKN